jgi:3-oxoacyl-[acyl-carrier protein] reductase
MMSSMEDLKNRVALITGGSRGIGAGIAVALARAGADVAVNYCQRADAANAVCAEITALGRKAQAVRADVSVAAEVKRMVAEVEEQLGPVDILVNNAGIAHPCKFEEIAEAEWDEVLTVNLKSVFLVTQAVVGGMRKRKWGRIINLSSVAARTGGIVGAHYAASKAGILGLTHSCASSFANRRPTSLHCRAARHSRDGFCCWFRWRVSDTSRYRQGSCRRDKSRLSDEPCFPT